MFGGKFNLSGGTGGLWNRSGAKVGDTKSGGAWNGSVNYGTNNKATTITNGLIVVAVVGVAFYFLKEK